LCGKALDVDEEAVEVVEEVDWMWTVVLDE
jgi:hypothetical protein